MSFAYALLQSIILMLLWYLIARYFYPYYARKTAIAVVSDPEYQRRSQEATEAWMSPLVARETHVIFDVVREEISKISIPELAWDAVADKHFLSLLNGWYGSLHNAVARQTSAEDENIRDAVEYANINQGNPQALDMIQKALAAKSPILAAGMALLRQGNNQSHSPPQGGRGGY